MFIYERSIFHSGPFEYVIKMSHNLWLKAFESWVELHFERNRVKTIMCAFELCSLKEKQSLWSFWKMSLNSISKLDLIWLLIFMMDRQHSVGCYFLARMHGSPVRNDPVHCPDFYLVQSRPSGYLYWSHGIFFSADVEHSDLNEMPMKSLYEAERVSNLLFTNETVFREHIIQVGKC